MQTRASIPVAVAVDHTFGVGVPRHQEIIFRDGTAVWLNQVIRAGAPDLFLRELGAPAPGTQIDLARLVPGLAKELPATPTRDVPGVVHFSLRHRFPGVDALLQEAVRQGAPQ
jgi:hypothetical protein